MVNTVLGKFGSRDMGLTVNIILWLVLFITAIAVFVPFYPAMPDSDLDPSWRFGMNQAVAQGLAIGKDIIFTFGPYASIYTKSYHPSTDFMMVSGSLYLALSYSVCFGLLMRSVQWYWVLAVCAVLTGFGHDQNPYKDPLFFSLPLLVGLQSYKILSWEYGRQLKSKLTYMALLFAPFGLLPIVKGSLLILCAAIAALCSVFFIVNRHRLLGIICLVSPLVSMLFFWIVSGQSVASLPSYFISMEPIVSGYTEAMALSGPILEVILYLIASVFLLLAISIQSQITITSKIFLFFTYFIFLFVSFKAGFVRHDSHALISGTSILIAALLLPFILNTRLVIPGIFFAFISWALIFCHYNQRNSSLKALITEHRLNFADGSIVVDSESPEHFINNIESTYLLAWNGIKNRITSTNFPRHKFDAAVKSLRDQAAFPILQGMTDIYSYNQSYLIASENLWSPRPIFQSYSAYTPTLAEANKKHFLVDKSPDNIFFKVETIDGRIPSNDDGASWPILMLDYQPIQMVKEYLLLQKKRGNSDLKEPLQLEGGEHKFGESVNLPHSTQPVFAQIEIKPTTLGCLASILFKPSQLQITFELENGVKKQYRIIAGMAKSGFLVSPIIENTTNFAMLYGKVGLLDDKRVKSIAIAPRDGKTLLWEDEYSVTFSQIKTGDPVNVSGVLKFNEFAEKLSNSEVITVDRCDGNIDEVNGISPPPEKVSVSTLLYANGWLAASIEKATLPEAIYMVLTDAQGKHKYLKTRTTIRPDVGSHFQKPELIQSGFTTIGDISALEGQYTLGLAMKESGTIKLCPQFNIPATISK